MLSALTCTLCFSESAHYLECKCSYVVFRVTEQLPPFYREIQPEEMWLYKFRRVEKDHVPTSLMFVSVCAGMDLKLLFFV